MERRLRSGPLIGDRFEDLIEDVDVGHKRMSSISDDDQRGLIFDVQFLDGVDEPLGALEGESFVLIAVPDLDRFIDLGVREPPGLGVLLEDRDQIRGASTQGLRIRGPEQTDP
jgi:hypothetical protein